VIEPHANAVYADARLPDDLAPAAWAVDVDAQSVADDREQLLVFGTDGQVAAVDIGSNPFGWRMPGVIAGVVMAACLYLLARILFARRLVALLVGAFVLLDGMLFVQSRIGMNDVYVGAFIIAAYTVFAAVWTGWWRGRGAFWIAMPIVGLLLGLGLASKWVAAYAIGALLLLLLVRSALGRVLAILGLIAITSVLGYLAIAVPAGQGAGNLPFLAIMITLTLVAVVTAVFHPIAWTLEEARLGLVAPAAAGVALFLGALTLGRLDATVVIGPLAATPVHGAIALTLGSLVVYGAYRVGAWFGYGPLAPPRRGDDPGRVLEPAASPPSGWLRPGWLAGLPIAWAALCLVGLPLVVYVASYLPWAAIENHQLWDGTPVGHTGQNLVELTRQMYDYHNGLTSPHPASSPWWAWPFDLKPVWFYQESLANGTSAAIYDAGNLVIWWLGVPAMAFAAVMAFRRRSPALALLAIGFASQWVSWARIDRAAFQYHYYTALPFVILALAYFVAELWHGASRRTWLVARIAAAVAIVAPAAMWLLSRPLCAFVGVQIANPGSQACPAVIPDLVLTLRTAALLAVVGLGTLVLWRGLRALEDTAEAGGDDGPPAASIRPALLGALVVAIAMAAASLLPETAILTLRGIPVEPIALIVALPLAWFASQVAAARDAHRFVVGLGVAVVAWFLVWYPNIAALPMPSTVVNAHQGLLPTYLYAFQFPVNTVARAPTALFTPMLALLAAAIAATALVVAYSASVWRLALAGSSTGGADSGDGAAAGEGSDGLARSGGGA
jgi:predicted membrane-bound dolichyl-phosphate-mannose-protein mannosyltransferase